MAFEDTEASAIYLLSDGKPDCSTSLVIEELETLNRERHLVINTISFNCDDMLVPSSSTRVGSFSDQILLRRNI